MSFTVPPILFSSLFSQAGSTSKNRKDFLIEASVMGQFKNLNVVTLEGVVTKSMHWNVFPPPWLGSLIAFEFHTFITSLLVLIRISFYVSFLKNVAIPLLIVTEFMENGSLDDYLKVRIIFIFTFDKLVKEINLMGIFTSVGIFYESTGKKCCFHNCFRFFRVMMGCWNLYSF